MCFITKSNYFKKKTYQLVKRVFEKNILKIILYNK